MTPEASTRESVLIPTGRLLKSYGCMRSLNRGGLHTIVASELDRIPHFSSRYCSEQARLPSPWNDLIAYKDALLELATRPDVKTIIPVRECDTYLFAKYRDQFDPHVSLVSPTLETLEQGHDRLQLATEAENAGVPTAETRVLSDTDGWDGNVVVKSRYNILTDEYVDSFSPGDAEEVNRVRFFRPKDEPDTQPIREEMKHDPIVQEFIPQATKHLYCALWDHGEPLVTYQHEQLRQISWIGGGGVYRISAFSREVEDVADRLLSHLDWHGFACIEYVKDENTGEWKFLEINPRVWQSLPEAVRMGVDFPYYYWLRAVGNHGEIDAGYDTGLACHMSYGEVRHLLSILRDDSPFVEPPSFGKTLWEITSSCITNPRFDYIRRDDLSLFLSALRTFVLDSGITGQSQYEDP